MRMRSYQTFSGLLCSHLQTSVRLVSCSADFCRFTCGQRASHVFNSYFISFSSFKRIITPRVLADYLLSYHLSDYLFTTDYFVFCLLFICPFHLFLSFSFLIHPYVIIFLGGVLRSCDILSFE